MGVVISTVNMKGGVGKTTLTVNLATCLAKNHGKRVLVLDLDAQISATLSLISPYDFAKLRKKRHTLSYQIDKIIRPYIKRKYSVQDMIASDVCDVKGMDLLPGDIELYDEYIVSERLYKQANSSQENNFDDVWNGFEENLLRSVINPVRNAYDFILLDCAPGYNLLTRSGIVASDFYLLPARPEPLSLVGIQLLERRIAKLKETHRDDRVSKLQLLGIVFILSGGSLLGRYYKQVMQRIEQDFRSSQIFANRIPMDINVAKAVDTFRPVVISSPNSPGTKGFIKLTEEFLTKLES